MGNAHRGDHDIAFYEAAIEETWQLDVTTTFAQLDDDIGPLRPGRWLVQLLGTNPASAICWVHVGPWEETASLGGTVGPGRRRIPLSRASVVAVEFHVLEGYNDRLGAILTAGTGTLYLSRVSTAIPKHDRRS